MIEKGKQGNIRVIPPNENKKKISMLVAKILGGSWMEVRCRHEDLQLARISDSKKRSMSRIRIGDLFLVRPESTPGNKAGMMYHSKKTEGTLLIKKDVLPENILSFFSG